MFHAKRLWSPPTLLNVITILQRSRKLAGMPSTLEEISIPLTFVGEKNVTNFKENVYHLPVTFPAIWCSKRCTKIGCTNIWQAASSTLSVVLRVVRSVSSTVLLNVTLLCRWYVASHIEEASRKDREVTFCVRLCPSPNTITFKNFHTKSVS